MEESSEVGTITQQSRAEQQSQPEIIEQQIPQEARFTSLLASACMSKVQEQWLGIVLYYEDLKHNALELAKRVQNIKYYAENALQMAFVTALLIQSPTTDKSSHPQIQIYEPQNKVELVNPSYNNEFVSNYQIPVQAEAPKIIQVEHSEATSTIKVKEESLQEIVMQPDKAPPTSKLDLLKTDEAYIKYGEYALSGPTLINPDVVLATVREYRDNDEHADEIAHWVNIYAQAYGMNTEVIMTAFMIQEGSFGKVTGNKSGDYNIGNIRAASTGEFLDFESYQQGVEAIFWQVQRYDQFWPTEKNDDTIHEIERAMEVYAPPHENPTQERIVVAKEFIDGIRLISDQYEKGEISQDQLQEKIHELRSNLQQKHNTEWI